MNCNLFQSEQYDEQRKEIAKLSNQDLANTCRAYRGFIAPPFLSTDAPTYDATFFHAIIPEMILRLGEIKPTNQDGNRTETNTVPDGTASSD